jgi:hypothetical protein
MLDLQTARLLHARLDQCRDSGAITGLEAHKGCRQHSVTRQSASVDHETSLPPKFPNEFALTATVAILEWMALISPI